MYKIDLNADLGESFGVYKLGMDEQILPLLTSANIACGAHAGDPVVMDKTVALAVKSGTAVGAHPGFFDLQGFGRRNISCTPAEIKAYVKYQLGALMAFTKVHGIKVEHVKTHGSLYNMSAVDEKISRAICEAIQEVDESIIFMGLSGSVMNKVAKEMGFAVASEVFADRAYTDEGTLVPRSLEGSVIHDSEEAIKRVLQMVKEGTVKSFTGKTIPIEAHSICVHGDNPAALTMIQDMRKVLTAEGVSLVPLRDIVKS